jgi:hypothetical protein
MSSIPAGLLESSARIALGHITREYPNKLDHVINDAADLRTPRALHPIFFGSFDWHSCVHGYWLLATILRHQANSIPSTDIRALFDQQFTADNVAAEVAYLGQPLRGGFERPYGWAWMLILGAELSRHEGEEGRRWHSALEPLVAAFVARFEAWVPKATYPIRTGTHFNTAFAVALASEYAATVGNARFGRLLAERAVAWYGEDRGCQPWEPSGDDFLSPALIEAECMRRVLPPTDFARWFDAFLPGVGAREPATLFIPVTVSDRTDGKIAHLDGVNFSRAWCWRSLASGWDRSDPRRAIARQAAETHLAASLPHVAGDYMGEHWLATFALLALLAN